MKVLSLDHFHPFPDVFTVEDVFRLTIIHHSALTAFCQAQLQLQLQLNLVESLKALISADPATHPPGHPAGIV